MTDDTSGHSEVGENSTPADVPAGPVSGPKRSSVPIWVWVVAAIAVVIVLLGAWGTQTEQGRLWILGLRSMAPVPHVVGQTESQAQATLETAGLHLGKVSEEPTLAVVPGTVLSQTPSAGTAVKRESAVDIGVASVPQVKVPGVVGQVQSDAVTTLADEGLRAGKITYVYDSTTSAGKVTAQQPAASTEATVGSAVDLTVSEGVKQGQVPNVMGLSQDDANSLITAAGFTVTTIKAKNSSVPAGDVSAQSPAAGVITPAGSTVTITVSTGAPAPPAPAPTTPPSTPAPSTPESTPATPENPAKPTEPTNPVKPVPPVAEFVTVPDVIGQSVKDAVTTLKAANLKVAFEYAPSDTELLKVIAQDPKADTTVDPGSTVVITIAMPKVSLPEDKPVKPEQLPAVEATRLPAVVPQPSVSATP